MSTNHTRVLSTYSYFTRLIILDFSILDNFACYHTNHTRLFHSSLFTLKENDLPTKQTPAYPVSNSIISYHIKWMFNFSHKRSYGWLKWAIFLSWLVPCTRLKCQCMAYKSWTSYLKPMLWKLEKNIHLNPHKLRNYKGFFFY